VLEHGVPTKWWWTVWYPENFKLGKNTDIGALTQFFCQYGIEIQDNVSIGGGCIFYSANTQDNTHGKIIVEKGAKIGAQSLVFPGVTIGAGAVVGAKSFVKKDVLPHTTVMGIPTK